MANPKLNTKQISKDVRGFEVRYVTSNENISVTSISNDARKVLNTVEAANNVDFIVVDSIADIGDSLIVDNDGTGVVRVIFDSTETGLGEGNTGENFETSENSIVIPQYSRISILKKKANLWRADGLYNTTTVDISAPTVLSATVEDADPDALVVVFDKEVNITNITGLSLDGSWTGVNFSSIQSGNGTSTVTFDLDTDILNGETGNFVYSVSNTIENLFGIPLVASNTTVTNNVGSTPAPTLYPDSYGSAAHPNSTNVITNGWTIATGTVTVSQGSLQVRTGTTSLRYESTSGGAVDHARTTDFTPAGFTSGNTYRLSGYSYHVSGTFGENQVRLYDPTAGLTTGTNLSTSAGWQPFTVDLVAGQSSGFRIYLYGDGEYYLDDLELIEL